jgi:hypothetical protein
VPTDVVRGSNLARSVLTPRYRWRWGGRVAEYHAPRALAVLPRTAVPDENSRRAQMVVVVENEGDRIQLVPLAAEAGAALLLALPDGSAEGLHGAGGCAFVSSRWCGSPVPPCPTRCYRA